MDRLILSILTGVLLLISPKVCAQEPGQLTTGFEMIGSLYSHKNLKVMEFSADVGFVTTKWLSIAAQSVTTSGMFNEQGNKTYRLVTAGGANIIFKAVNTDYGTLSFNMTLGSTIGGDEWEYNYYSGGVHFNFGQQKVKPSVGFGVKYYDTKKKSNLDNYCRFYFSIGFRL